VGGLITEKGNKLHDQNFIDQIKEFDIVLLSETHVGYETTVDVENFFYYPFCRQKSKNNRYFGGLGILIKKDIRKGIKFLEDGNSEYQWLKLDKSFFQLKKDIYLCTLYLVPQSSPYLTKMEINVLETIERDLIEKYNEKGDIILMGDFNARTGSEEDLIISDDTSHVPLSDNQYVIDTAVGKRSSHDSHIDTRGKELLDMCISLTVKMLG
jgi:exonuclease III